MIGFSSLGLHANLSDQVHGDRNSRGNDLVGKRDGEWGGLEAKETIITKNVKKEKVNVFFFSPFVCDNENIHHLPKHFEPNSMFTLNSLLPLKGPSLTLLYPSLFSFRFDLFSLGSITTFYTHAPDVGSPQGPLSMERYV